MQFKQAGEFIIGKLRTELPACLSYHNADHTLDVYQAAKHLGEQEGLTGREMTLLLTAAWYHDSGFLQATANHENISCQIAAEALPAFGYTADDIKTISEIIMATRLPQSPKSHLGEILADADLDYLGRDDFFSISDKLFDELTCTSKIHSKAEWNRVQVEFLQQHQYFTKSARHERQAKKEHILQQIKAELP
jgi:uncharacterized protein